MSESKAKSKLKSKSHLSSKNKSDEHAKTSPVFRIKPINRTNNAIIKYVGLLNENEKLGDEPIELDAQFHSEAPLVGKNAIPIKNINIFEMVGRLYRCNIIGSHIVMSNRYPIMYLNIHYDRPMVSGSLLQIFYSIDIDKEQKKEVKDNKKYVNLKFSGTWYRHIDCDDEFIQNYEKVLTEILETEAIEKIYKSAEDEYSKIRETMNEEQIIDWIDKYVANERQYYDNLMKQQVVNFKSISKTRDELIKLCTCDKFHKFLQLAMKCREIYRRSEYGLDDKSQYNIPKEIIKMSDIKKKLIKNNELILSSDDESENNNQILK